MSGKRKIHIDYALQLQFKPTTGRRITFEVKRMKKAGCVIYLLFVKDEKFSINLAFDPKFELSYFLQTREWSPGNVKAYRLTELLPVGLANYIYRKLGSCSGQQELQEIKQDGNLFDSLKEKLGLKKPGIEGVVANYSQQVENILAYYGLADYSQVSKVELDYHFDFPAPDELARVQEALNGRLLFYKEIKQALGENRVKLTASLSILLQTLKLESKLEVKSGIAYRSRNDLVCRRCGQSGNLVEIDCNYCGLTDYYCANCLQMGRSRICRPLYAFQLAEKRSSSITLSRRQEQRVDPKLEFELTAAQRDAGQELIQFISSRQAEALVWAVCGAGKTEVSFQAIAEVLTEGGQVLFAIPRKDAVIELAPRLEESFPDFEISLLHGSSENKYRAARITVATTHQVLRFEDKFDLVVLDEMDAFPYQGSEMLKYAVYRSCRPEGKIIFMTATPGDELMAFRDHKDKLLVKIPARYHGHPVPEPELLTAELDYKQEAQQVELPEKVMKLIYRSVKKDQAQLFVFLPTRELVELAGRELQQRLPEENNHPWVEYSHAQDEARDRKRDGFCDGEYPILVSTTIMERAITVPKANVLVLFADWKSVFTVSALIQMGGRSGRSLEHPEGNVWFVGQRVTAEMRQAKSRIKSLNQEAQQKGYITEQDY
ncbi:type III restriction protein res subunit [Acetohalobium arabaticum DSM 5501]|uniref:Type III restriction protein res subunit n=2 Tax=Acetohalobium TaxID=28186 RepID=D9QTM8_ACEAZ|nr:type III restriction protein res subunit [Acetohalobium arabaticum DSM 5501]